MNYKMKKQITKVGHIITIKNKFTRLQYKFIEGPISKAEKKIEQLKYIWGADENTYYLSNEITLKLNKK